VRRAILASPSPGRRARPAGVLALLALLAGAAVASAQALVSQDLRAEAARLLREIATHRGQSSPGAPPPLVIQTRDERRRFVTAELARKYSPARLDAERRALVAWGLVPGDFDLAGFLAELLAEQAAAYYDPVAKRMILANWLTPELRRDALTHELVHVLQDRQVDLDRFLRVPSGRSDEGLARQALVEGEAVALSHDLGLRRAGRDFAARPDVADLQRALRSSATGPVLARAPAYLRSMLTFPYADGIGFVHAFRQRRPWAELSAVYRDPPRSSSQILHPARYLDQRVDPPPISLPDLAGLLPPGSRVAIEDTLGEVGAAEVLRSARGEAAGAVGWRGDRYALWDLPGVPSLLVALFAWDTEEIAAGFARAYARVMVEKRGLATPSPGLPFPAWSVGTTAFAIEQRQRTVLVLADAPATALDALRAAVWATPVLY
jgi:hypothetical protein